MNIRSIIEGRSIRVVKWKPTVYPPGGLRSFYGSPSPKAYRPKIAFKDLAGEDF
jgi:hypothetical protein